MNELKLFQTLGSITTSIDAIKEDVAETKSDVKNMLQENATVQERLKQSNKRFSDHEARIYELEKKPFPIIKITAIASVFLTLLGLMIKFLK